MDKRYRVLIVEDDPMVRQMFEVFIENSVHYEVAYAIGNADMADLYCVDGNVQLVLMDIRTSMQANGLDAAERIKDKHPEIKVIIVTSMPEQAYLERARCCGADSFWYKTVLKESFIELMDKTMAGERVFPDTPPCLKIGNVTNFDFTEREMEVLRELTTGAPNQLIAEKLFISERTVKSHIQHMLEKTGFSNRVELAVKAREAGIAIGDN